MDKTVVQSLVEWFSEHWCREFDNWDGPGMMMSPDQLVRGHSTLILDRLLPKQDAMSELVEFEFSHRDIVTSTRGWTNTAVVQVRGSAAEWSFRIMGMCDPSSKPSWHFSAFVEDEDQDALAEWLFQQKLVKI